MNDLVSSWFRAHRYRRRAVSRWRRRVGIVVLILIVAGGVSYRRLTSEDRLGALAERWMERFTGGQATVDHVSFDLFSGLHLVGVRLALPESMRFDPDDNSLEARTVFHSSAVFLRLRPLSIITGDLVVPEIVAEDPELTLVRRMSDGLGNWEAMLARRQKRDKRELPSQLPVIRLRNARLFQQRLDADGRSEVSPEIIYAEAQHVIGQSAGYEIAVTTLGQAADTQEPTGETGRIHIDLKTLAVSGSLPTVTIDKVAFLGPPAIAGWLDLLDLNGQIRTESFNYDPQSSHRLVLALHDASLSIPIDETENDLPSDRRYARFSRVDGSITLDGKRATVALAGYFRDSRLDIHGVILMPDTGPTDWAGVGLQNIEIKAHDVPLPRHEESTDSPEVRFVRRWNRLRKFVDEYDGIGNVDLSLTLEKKPGPGETIELVEAILSPLHASGRYVHFPYRVYSLTGDIRFRPDEPASIENLTGTRDSSRITLNGHAGGYWSRLVDLDIQGTDIRLDRGLLDCLSEHDQALCRLFQAQARMDVRVHLKRADYEPPTERPPWQRTIDVTFRDGSVNFGSFAYPLNQLSGQMRIEAGQFRIDELRAAAGPTRVRVTGTARRSDEEGTGLDLNLTAKNVPLDEVLARALPASAREQYDALNPAGRFDLAGRVFTRAAGQPVEYDLTASLTDGAFALPGMSGRLNDVTGEIRIKPRRLEIKSLQGRLGKSTIELTGWLSLDPHDRSASLHVKASDLLLDDALRDALPDSLRKTWDSFAPIGTAKVHLEYERSKAGPAEYRLAIEPQNCHVLYAGFPLPLSEVNGMIEITRDSVDISAATARYEDARLTVDGKVNFLANETQVALKINAHEVTFAEPLRKAVPWRLQRLWNDVNPTGTVDLVPLNLTFSIEPRKQTTCTFDGRADLRNVTIDTGIAFTEINGQVTGSGQAGREFSINSTLKLDRVLIDGQPVTGLETQIVRPADNPLLQVDDLRGSFHGGKLVGQAEVDYSPGGPTYGLTLSVRDFALKEFLNAKRKPDEQHSQLEGLVDGNLSIGGRLGDPQSRRGGGAVVIRNAQMFKVPMMLAILQVIHFAIDDDNAIQDGVFTFLVRGEELILEEIDLRGKAFSLVGAGRVHTPSQTMHLILLVGSPLPLPKIAVLSELIDRMARELMEVHVEGTLEEPIFRADIVRSARKTIEAIVNMRHTSEPPR